MKMNTAVNEKSRAGQPSAPGVAVPTCLITRCTNRGAATAASKAFPPPATGPTANLPGGTGCGVGRKTLVTVRILHSGLMMIAASKGAIRQKVLKLSGTTEDPGIQMAG